MRPTRFLSTVVMAAAMGSALSTGSGLKGPDKSTKMGLRILYVGHPGSAREKDFVGFLSTHVVEVKTADLAEFDGQQTAGFEVMILDYDGDGFKAPRPRLSREYARPTVTVGVIGAFICGSLRLKSGYL